MTDEGGRVITGETRVPASYGKFRLSAGQKQWAYKAGETAQVNVTTRDYDGQPVSAPFRALVSRWNGDFRKYFLIASLDGKTAENGSAVLPVRMEKEGQYDVELVAADDNGREIHGRTWMFVPGGEGRSYSWYQDEEISVTGDKKSYEPGDVARLMLIGKEPGFHYFVTVEAGSTLKSYEVSASGTTAELALPITDELAPNFFVHLLTLSKGTAYETQGYGAESFEVSQPHRELKIEVQPSKGQFEPGDEATVKITTVSGKGKPESAELSLGVVDAAIYALRQDTAPVMLTTFYPERHTEIESRNSLTFVFSDMAGEGVSMWGVPGGVMGGVLGGIMSATSSSGPRAADAFVEPRVRKEFPDTAYWVGDVQTDANGEATLRFRVPDTLTTWRTTARGITEDTKVGSAVHEVISRKNVLLRMSAPRFLRTGDEVTISAFVHNYLATAKQARVSLEVEGLEIVSGETKDIELPSGGDVGVSWVVRASSPGQAKFTAKALTNEESDAIENTIPVHPLGVKLREGNSGILDPHSATHSQTISFPENSTPKSRKIVVQLAPSIAAAAMKSLNYLTTYPYGCTEQTMSSFVPNTIVTRAIRGLGVKSDVDEAKLRKKVAAGLALLYKNQHASGGWGWWEQDLDQPFMTAYVVAGLSQARAAGYKVDDEALERGRKWLVSNFDIRGNGQHDLRAYMLYAITLDKPDRKLIDEAWENRRFLSLYGSVLLGLALQEAKDQRAAELLPEIEKAVKETPQQAHWEFEEDPLMGLRLKNDVEVTAFAVQFLARENPKSALLPKAVAWLMQRRDGGEYWRSTKHTSMVLMALTEYLKATRELEGETVAEIYLNGAKVGSYALDARKNTDAAITVELDATQLKQGANEFRLERKGSGPVYWAVASEYFTSEDVTRSKGLKIQREYYKMQRVRLDESWDSLLKLTRMSDMFRSEPLKGTVRPGDVLAVKVTVTGDEWKYMMVEDPIPAGTELIEPNSSMNNAFGYTPYYVGREYHDDRASFFRTQFAPGSGQFIYYLRVINPGKFGISQGTAQTMYQPDAFSATHMDALTVTAGAE